MDKRGGIIPVILAGGAGARLAPLTSEAWPKPFLPLPNGNSLLTQTCARVLAPGFAAPLVIGQAEHRFALLNHVRAACMVPQAILLEPAMRNTALAIASVAALLERQQPDAMLAILPADHHIAPEAAWRSQILALAAYMEQRHDMGLMGVRPTHASMHYGYLKREGSGSIGRVTAFIEKPHNPATLLGQETPASSWLWNMGQCVAPVKNIVAALKRYAPQVWQAGVHATSSAQKLWEFTQLDAAAYINAPAMAFDHAVLEKAAVSAATFEGEWCDLGTPAAWHAHTGKPVTSYTLPCRTDRPWGYFELIREAPGEVEKQLIIYPGCRLSLQRHLHRDEFWHVIEGTAHIIHNSDSIILQKNERLHIKSGSWHRLENNTNYILIIRELQKGTHDENDIERKSDDYGRI